MMEAELHAVGNWSRLSDRDIHTLNRFVFASPQFETPDLAGDGLRQFHGFNAPDALIGRRFRSAWAKIVSAVARSGAHPAARLI
jgi:hypothetical protein